MHEMRSLEEGAAASALAESNEIIRDLKSQAALGYAARGWLVFPVHGVVGGRCTCGTLCGNAGKHPRTANGFHAATRDADLIRDWWVSWPEANIGIRTGAESNLVVLDVDAGKGGEASVTGLEGEHGALPPTAITATGGGGRHLFFRHPGGVVRSTAGELGPGLDVRADGGYVVAPPSRHVSGGEYEWANGEPVVAALPDWLVDLLVAPPPASSRPERPLAEDVIPVGARNTTLASLAGAMRGRGMNQAAILAGLAATNETRCEIPLHPAEVERIAASVARYEPEPRRYKQTDYGNAERLVDLHGHELRFTTELGWLVWDGARWKRDDDGAPMRRMKHTVRSIYTELDSITDPDERQTLVRFATKSEGAARLKSALALAESEAPLAVAPDALDSDPWLFNVANGTLDLRTGHLREHRREDLLTNTSPARYDPEARALVWESFLDRITGGDRELRSFLQRAVGYTLTGDTREEKLFFAHGPAATGKSTFLEAIKAVLGDYATTSDFDTFTKRKGDSGVRNDIARLAGKRMVVGVEVDDGKQLAEGLVKTLTGGDKVTARFLFKEHFEFLPQLKLWLAANDRPHVNANDPGIWRRIVQVPFTETIPEPERDPTLKLALRTDAAVQSAILAWAVEGCLAWQEQGLGVPDRVRAYTEEYRAENDPVRDFLDERCRFEPDATVPRSELMSAYQRWAQQNGEKPVDPKVLAASIRARGATDGPKTRGERTWKGIALPPEAVQPAPATSPPSLGRPMTNAAVGSVTEEERAPLDFAF